MDASDGPFENNSVNNEIPANVEINRNVYQTNKSGHSSYSSESCDSSGTSFLPASHGGKNIAKDPTKTKVLNHDITSKSINHGNIDEVNLDNNVKTIENIVTK